MPDVALHEPCSPLGPGAPALLQATPDACRNVHLPGCHCLAANDLCRDLRVKQQRGPADDTLGVGGWWWL